VINPETLNARHLCPGLLPSRLSSNPAAPFSAENQHWTMSRQNAVANILSVSRTRESETGPMLVVIGWSHAGGQRQYAYEPTADSRVKTQCFELILRDLVPTPGPEVSFEDVIRFREKHQVEVATFRQAITSLAERVASSTDPYEELRNSREEIQSAILQMQSAGKRRGLQLTLGGVSLLALASIGVGLFSGDPPQVLFSGLGTSAVSFIVQRPLRRTLGDGVGPFAYLYESAVAFGG